MKKIITLLLLLAITTGYGQTSQNSAGAKLAKAVQCSGTTKSGVKCKKMTKDKSGLCYMHNPSYKPYRLSVLDRLDSMKKLIK